jgi:hypothetical protein
MGLWAADDGGGLRNRVTRRFGVFLALALYTSVFFRSFRVHLTGTGVSLVPTDILVLIAVPIGLALLVRHRKNVRAVTSVVSIRLLVLGGLFLVYHAYLNIKSPQPIRGFSLMLLLIRDLIILSLLAGFLHQIDLSHVNRGIFTVSVAMAVPALACYFIVVRAGNAAVLGPLDETVLTTPGVPRLQWFVADPNFFGILLLLGLLSGYHTVTQNSSLAGYAGILVVSVAVLTTLSRSIIGLFFVLTILYVIGVADRGDDASGLLGNARRLIPVIVLVVGSGLVILSLFNPEQLLIRLKAGLGSGRLSLWSELASGVSDHLLTGAGLRASEVVLGRYAHNSYLEILYDTGLVGLLMFLLILTTVAIPALRKWLRGTLCSTTPWWLSFVALVPFMFVFSFGYQPLTWLLFSVVAIGVGSTSLD